MNTTTETMPPTSSAKALRQLFLTLFLRGRGSRGLQKQKVPKSVGQKLALTLLLYAALGLLALAFRGQPIFALSVYLHAMTFVFLGMFVASSAGEILFNNEEADILLHRPITPRTLLWAKIRVLIEVSLWLAGSFNLVGFFVPLFEGHGGWAFPVVHAFSTVLEALFCTGTVVMVYQLCLRWFGRERLDGLMTLSQIVVSIAAVLSGQVLPQLIFRSNKIVAFDQKTWWIALLPPAWFAGFDDALAGTGAMGSWVLAGFAIAITAAVLWTVFGKLARDYESGLQRLGEITARRPRHRDRRRWIDAAIDTLPFRWWMRDPVSRASFLLTAAYLTRDRDVKLRVYPALAPMLVLPIVLMAQEFHGRGSGTSGIGILFVGGYLGVIPMMGLNLLQYSQQWHASDIFRVAPMPGPGAICNGARRAVLLFLVLPLVALLMLLVWLWHRGGSELMMLLPGVIAMPVFALIPNLGGRAVPLSFPSEEAKSAGRGLTMFGGIIVSMALSVLAYWSRSTGWFWYFVPGEMVVTAVVYIVMRRSITNAKWQSME